MDRDELVQRLDDIEWEDFEVKEAESEIPKNSWETVSAFSNTAGGWLVFGVGLRGNDYEIIGVRNPEKIEQNFTTILRSKNKFNKIISTVCKKYVFNDKTVLVFYIPSADKKPVYFNSRQNTFIRTGSGDQRATDNEIDSMFREQSFSSKDRELTRFTFDDLDKKTIEDYRIYLNNVNPKHRYNNISSFDMLEKLQAIVDGKITVGGLLVFGKEEQINSTLIDFRIDYLEIPGVSYSEAPTRYTYRLSEEENLFRFYFSIIERLMKKIDIPFMLNSDGLVSEMQPQAVSIREALVNLLMHSDYFSTMKPRIRVFSDRIEFMNPGALPKDIKSIMKEDFTQPRNTIIAKIFRAIKLSENAGSGFDKMFTGWKSYYQKNPVVAGDIDYYKIVFYFDKLKTSLNLLKREAKNEAKDEAKDERQEMILKRIKSGNFTIRSFSRIMGISRSTIGRDLKELKEKNIIKRIESSRGGKFVILVDYITPQDTPQVTPQVSLTELEFKIFNEISKNTKISRRRLSENVGVSSDTIKEYIEKLKKKGVLVRVGKTSGGYWKVVRK